MKKETWCEIMRYFFFVFFVAGLVTFVYFARAAANKDEALSLSSSVEAELRKIFPSFDNKPEEDSFLIGVRRIYPAYRILSRPDASGTISEGYELLGFAFFAEGQGYSDRLRILMGVNPEGKVVGVTLIRQNEPLGYGETFAGQKSFFNSLRGRTREELLLTDEGGEIHAVSSATVTSRSVVRLVREATHYFHKYRSDFMSKLPSFLAGEGEVAGETAVSEISEEIMSDESQSHGE